MILDDGILVLDDILVIETLQHIDFFFDSSNVLLADRDLLHGNQNAVIEVDTFVHLSIGSFPDLFN